MEVNFLHRDVCGSLQKLNPPARFLKASILFRMCYIHFFFCAWPSLGFLYGHATKKQGVIFLMTLPSVWCKLIRLLPADSLEKFGELGDKTPQKMLPIRLKLIRKKTAPTFSQLYVGGQPFPEIREFSTHPSVRLTRNGSFFFGIIFRRFRLHYENTAEMVLILWKHLQKILNSNVVY